MSERYSRKLPETPVKKFHLKPLLIFLIEEYRSEINTQTEVN